MTKHISTLKECGSMVVSSCIFIGFAFAILSISIAAAIFVKFKKQRAAMI